MSNIILTNARKEQFLKLVSETGSPTTAAAQLGMSYTTVRNYISKDPLFKEQFEIARAIYQATLEQAAHERAVKGVKKKIYYQGAEIGEETVYSDRLLETLLKANDPDKYGKGGSTHNTLVIGNEESTLAALGKFLGVDLDKKEKPVEDVQDDIIDGEYTDTSE